MAHTRRSPPDEPDDNSDDSAHSWLLQVALEPSGQLVATLQNNYLFSFTLRKVHLQGGLGLQLYDTHAGALCVRHVWPYGAVHSWNKLCAGTHQEVRRGDFIIQVNKASGNAARMLEECGKDYVVKLTLTREDPSCLSPPARISSLNAEAPEFVPGGPAWMPHQTEERQPAKRWTVCDSTKAIQGRVETELATYHVRHSGDHLV